MTRVIHTGDTHVGYRQYHSPERREDFLAAFRRVIEDATDEGVDAVVHAGDLFNDRRPDLQDLLGTISVLETLRQADIPFLAIVGNHEDARNGQWLDLFEQLGLATHLDSDGTVVDDTVFYGLDYVPESKRDSLEYGFERREAEHSALVGHGLFTPFPHGDWDIREVLDGASVAFDAVLLGDDHTPDTKRVEDTWVTYCGSTERTSASEREPRGYNIVTFEEDVSITRRGIETRPFVFVDVELSPADGAAYVRERIRESQVEDAVVIVTVDGDGDSITPAEVEEFGREQGALITRVNDRREFDDAAEVEVSFGDPDDAVRDRVREMGLSEAARTVDSVVREPDIARSNVRDRVREQVREHIEDPEAFHPGEPPYGGDAEGTPESSGDAEEGSDPEPGKSGGEGFEETAAAGPEAPTASTTNAESTTDGQTATPTRGESTTDDGQASDENGEATTDDGQASDENGEATTDDGQASDENGESTAEDPDDASGAEPRETTMEDFL